VQAHCVLAAHDLSEGGLGAAAAEMALAGRKGIRVDLDAVSALAPERSLFSESQSRILLEVAPDRLADLVANLGPAPHAVVGSVTGTDRVEFTRGKAAWCTATLAEVERAWKRPLDFDGTLVPEVRP
jgi:phosphoribosylformylglycinamidine synthase